jgi:hypothetical protein
VLKLDFTDGILTTVAPYSVQTVRSPSAIYMYLLTASIPLDADDEDTNDILSRCIDTPASASDTTAPRNLAMQKQIAPIQLQAVMLHLDTPGH